MSRVFRISTPTLAVYLACILVLCAAPAANCQGQGKSQGKAKPLPSVALEPQKIAQLVQQARDQVAQYINTAQVGTVQRRRLYKLMCYRGTLVPGFVDLRQLFWQ